MHTHFDDGDWQAAQKRYKQSTAVPDELLVPGLDEIRGEIGTAQTSPTTAGSSFVQLLEAYSISEQIISSAQKELLGVYGDAHDLLRMIRNREVSIEEVTEAHLRMAALAQQALGCYSEIFFDQARRRAKELDGEIAGGKVEGSLLGLPISVKAHIALENTGSDRGFIFDVLDPSSAKLLLDEEEATGAKYISKSTLNLLRIQGDHEQKTDGVIAAALLAEGAIVIAKTVMPQSVMQLDTCSNLHGQTLNPCNIHLSPGGSSGGESASVAAGATVAGIGTDIGGSVRQPAAVTGLYGIRCTVGRVAIGGTRSTMLGNEGILGTAGPLCRSARDLQLLTEVLIRNTGGIDPYSSPPLPLRKIETPKTLRIGVLQHDGIVRPITPIRRALQHSIGKLANHAGIEIIDCSPTHDLYQTGWSLARELYFMENGALIRGLAKITGEPLLPLTEFIMSFPVRDHTASESWELQYKRESFKRRYWQEVWVKNKLDVLLCPASHLCAPRVNSIRYWNYTSFFNLVDLPGAVFPVKVMVVDSKIDSEFETKESTSMSSLEILSETDKEAQEEYAAARSVFDGAPIGLQLIGHRYREEELLGALHVIDDIINNSD